MSIELTSLLLALLFNVIAVFFNTIELRFNRRSRFIEIARAEQDTYNELNRDRQGFYHYYLDENFDLEKVKAENPEDHKKIIHWESRFFWHCWFRWIEAHERRSVPRYLKKDWDYATKASLKNPLHRQAWEKEIRKMDFMGKQEFKRFIERCMEEN